VSGGITGPPCSWGILIREPGPPGWGSLRWDSKVWFRVLSDSDHWVITPQIADPSSRHRGRPPNTRPQISDSNIQTGSNILPQVPQGCSIRRHTDWLTVSRKVTSNFLGYRCSQHVGGSHGRVPHMLGWRYEAKTSRTRTQCDAVTWVWDERGHSQ
jgi:hypothetical protein